MKSPTKLFNSWEKVVQWKTVIVVLQALLRSNHVVTLREQAVNVFPSLFVQCEGERGMVLAPHLRWKHGLSECTPRNSPHTRLTTVQTRHTPAPLSYAPAHLLFHSDAFHLGALVSLFLGCLFLGSCVSNASISDSVLFLR